MLQLEFPRALAVRGNLLAVVNAVIRLALL